MQQWEYETILILGMTLSEYEKAANSLGSNGWELVSVFDFVAYFKRPLETEDIKAELGGMTYKDWLNEQ